MMLRKRIKGICDLTYHGLSLPDLGLHRLLTFASCRAYPLYGG